MIRPLVIRPRLAAWAVSAAAVLGLAAPASAPAAPQAQAPAPAGAKDGRVPGQFFPIVEPVTSETVDQIRAATKQVIDRAAARGQEPVLVFEFQPGDSAPGATDFYEAMRLADLISTQLAGARQRVAYVPKPLKGYAVLAAMACDEIVMGKDASLGPIAPDGEGVDPSLFRDPIRQMAVRKGRDPDLLLGMLDRDADLRAVRTDDRRLHFVFASNLDEFKTSHQVAENVPAWDAGRRGVLTSARAREMGFSKLTADTPPEVADYYRLEGYSSGVDPTLGRALKPVWIEVKGPIDTVKKSYLSRRIEQARQEKVNLVFFQIDSAGGIDTAADAVADAISGVKDMKTVAFVDVRAKGVSALLALACDDIVFNKDAQVGDVSHLLTGGGEVSLDAHQEQALAGRAEYLAKKKGHPVAVARAMVDTQAVLLSAKDRNTGAPVYVLQTQADGEPGRYVDTEVVKQAGDALTVKAEQAETFGVGHAVGDVEEFKGLYGFRGKPIRVDGPTWVDSLVTVLTDPFVSWLLLFVGLFMLVVELKLPGIGLPAITSALAFLLFFWSHYLSGTADQLEIILFLVGMVCLALELFVFPGFGVFGMCGVLLILTSIVMASHTFVWPTQEYEYREMGYTLLQVVMAMVAVGAGAVVLARYFPSLPLFNKLVLKPEPWTGFDAFDPEGKPPVEGYDSLAFLVGETGRSTTMLRPTGKARFGEMLIDVSADGFFIEPDSLVEVVDVQGTKVIVKQVGI